MSKIREGFDLHHFDQLGRHPQDPPINNPDAVRVSLPGVMPDGPIPTGANYGTMTSDDMARFKGEQRQVNRDKLNWAQQTLNDKRGIAEGGPTDKMKDSANKIVDVHQMGATIGAIGKHETPYEEKLNLPQDDTPETPQDRQARIQDLTTALDEQRKNMVPRKKIR